MPTAMEILRLVGIGLLILGGASGAALFFRAIGGVDKEEHKSATGTLWGLFIIGMVGGIILVVVTHNY